MTSKSGLQRLNITPESVRAWHDALPDVGEVEEEEKKPTCEGCGGAGFIGSDKPPRVERGVMKFVALIPCPTCRPIHDGLDDIKAFVIPPEYDPEVRATMERAKALAIQVALTGSPKWVIFIGPNGSGKNHLADGIIQARRVRGDRVRALRATTLLEYMYVTQKQGEAVLLEEYRALRKLDWLLLDEFGKQTDTDFSVRVFETIMDERYVDRAGTILTMNVNPLHPDTNLPPAIKSRIGDRALAEIISLAHVPDYRWREDRSVPV